MEAKNLQRKRRTWLPRTWWRLAKLSRDFFFFFKERQARASPIKEHDILKTSWSVLFLTRFSMSP